MIQTGVRFAIRDMQINLQSTARVEWLWTIVRITVITVTMLTALLLWSEPTTGIFAIGAAGAASVHTVFAAWMIRRGYIQKLLLFTFTLDTLAMLVGWTGSLWLLGSTAPPSDLYLALFPILAVWTARLGFALGSVYLGLWLSWIYASYTIFFDPSHYANEQLPVRIAFLGLAGLISMGVTSIAKQQKKELQRSREETESLKESNAAKDEFIAGLSHELRTPLTAMLGFNSLLQKNKTGNLGPAQLNKLDVVERNGRRLESMISDLLDVSKIENGQIELHKEPISLSDLVTDIAESFGTQLSGNDQTIELASDLQEDEFIGDRARLGQVLTNLISNASKYSGPGAIELDASVAEGYVRIVVTDHGSGISEEDQERIFMRFYRTEDAVNSAVSGTGIGLYLCQNLVSLHGGEISVSSRPGTGTSMCVEFPHVEPTSEHRSTSVDRLANRFTAFRSA